MTLRIKFGKIYKQLESSSLNVVKTMYYVTLTDADIKGFLLLKHQRRNQMDFNAGDQFIADKIKLSLNAKHEVVLFSTSLTVLRSESDENFTVESLELS